MAPIGGDSKSKAKELGAWPLSVGTLRKILGRESDKSVPGGVKGRQDWREAAVRRRRRMLVVWGCHGVRCIRKVRGVHVAQMLV